MATTIGRLRVEWWRTGDAACPSLAPLRMLDLEAPAMPPQAILCIRRLRDPLPGSLDLGTQAMRASKWESAARGAVASELATAARPARGFVPANANAVFFADRAELLACAARDGLRDWWWEYLVPPTSDRSPAAVVREWLREPVYIAAAVELLVERRDLVPFVRAMPASDAVRLIDAVLRAHLLPEVASRVVSALVTAEPRTAPPIEAVPPSPAPVAGAVPAPAPSPVAVPVATRERDAERAPDHRPAVGNASSVVALVPELAGIAFERTLTVEQRAFVVIALLVRRAPVLVRREAFVREVVEWIERELRVEASAVPAHSATQQVEREVSAASPSSAAATESRSEKESEREEGRETTSEPFLRRVLPPEARETRAPHEVVPVPAISECGGASHRSGTDPVITIEKEPQPWQWPPHSYDHVGLFFLLTPMLALGFYSDFTSPAQRGLDADLWQFLRYAARTFLGREFENDPLDDFLAELAEEELEEPPVDEVEQIRAFLFDRNIDDPMRVVGLGGGISLTPTHLDIWFSLAAHPIELRIAALDRDPGWIPAAGRHVAFHFD